MRRALLSILLAFALLLPALATAGDPAPEANRATVAAFDLEDLKGEHIRIEDFKGKVVVISFWATWCAPCLQELPHLDRFNKEYGEKGFVVLAISTDGPETAPVVRRIARRGKWSMPVLLDTEGTVSSLLNPRGTNPFTVFVDRNGRIAHTHEGYTPGDEAKYVPLIEKLLGEEAK